MASKSIEFDAVVSAGQINKLLADLRSGAEGAAKAINDALGGSVTKKIVFEEVVSGNGVKQLVAVEKERLTIADQLINKQKQLNKTQEGSKTNLQQTLNNLRQQRDGVARYQTTLNSAGQSIRIQRQEWTSLNAQVSTVARQLDIASASGFWDQLKVSTNTQGLINIGNGLVQITNQLQAASIIVGQFVGAINDLIDAAAQIQSFNLAFQAIGAGAAGGARALQESSRIALGLGVDLNTVQEGFKQLSPVVLNIGGTLGDVSGVVESLSSRFAAFGISGDRARRVTQGVIQAFAKGKLQAEELTQQISEADPAFKTDFAGALFAARSELGALGKQVDGSTANLEKLVKAGRITADVLLKVLPGISKSGLLFGRLGPTAGTAVDALERGSVTIDQVRSNLKNLNQLSLRDLAKSAEPLINAFLRAQAIVTDFFSGISKSSSFEAFASIAARVVEGLSRLTDVFFIAVEGVFRFAEAIKPILDLLASIPGLAEIAGVALLGKLLGPFKLLEGKLAKVQAAWTGFSNAITGSPREAVASVTNSIKQLQTQLLRPVKVNVDTTGVSSGLAGIGSAVAVEAGNAVEQIDRKIEQSLRSQERLRQKIAEIEPTGKAAQSESIDRELKSLKEQGKELTRQRNEIKRLISEQGRLAPVPGGGATTLSEALRANTKAARVLDFAQAELLKSRQALNATPVFTSQEEQRLTRLNSQLKASIALTSELRGERIRAEQAASTTRRERIGFDPSVINRQQKYIDLVREGVKQDILSGSARFQALDAREKAIRGRLAAIEKERRDLAQAFPVLKPRPEEFRTNEIRELRNELRDLTEEKGRFSTVADRASIAATNFAKILEEGSSESSTFAQRQTALYASFGLSEAIIRRNAVELKTLRARYREVAAEGRVLEKQRQARPFSGLVPKDDPLTLAITENKGRLARIRSEIDAIAGSSREAITAQKGITVALNENAKTAPLFARLNTAVSSFSASLRESLAVVRGGAGSTATAIGASFARSLPVLVNFAKTGVGGITKALEPLKAGLAGIIGLVDPLLAAFIAFGIASRLYADGNREAAQTAKDFKQTLDNLTATRADILPGVATSEKAETSLDRAYRSITVKTVEFVDGINAKLRDLGNGFFGFIERIRSQAPALKSQFAEVAGSVGLISGVVALSAISIKSFATAAAAASTAAATAASGAAAAGAVPSPATPALLGFAAAAAATALAIAGLVAVTGNDAKNKLKQLTKELTELRSGAAGTAEAVASLSTGILVDIKIDSSKETSKEDIDRLKAAAEGFREARDQIQTALDSVRGREVAGKSQASQLQKEVELGKERLAQIRQQKQELVSSTGGRRAQPEDATQIRALTEEEGRLARVLGEKEEKLAIVTKANGELGIASIALAENLKTANKSIEDISGRLTQAQKANIQYANTIGEINQAIKDIGVENEGLRLTDPEDQKTLDGNLLKIKGFQAVLEQISKTKYEVNIEVRNLRGIIADAQTRIDIEPGDLRDTVELVGQTSREINNASDEFSQTIEGIKALGDIDNIAPEKGAIAIEQAGLKFLGATREAAANLADQGRKLQETLDNARKSLTNLKLSKPEFFSEAELKRNAEQINRVFEEEVKLAGFTPKLSGKTSLEILQQKAAFNETRQEARKLEETIATIPAALDKITTLLADIAGKDATALKKIGMDVNKEIDKSRNGLKGTGKAVEQVAKTAPRIGQVFGRIGAAGKEVVLYYDNVTGKTEEVTAAQFKALQAADKLAAGGAKVGAGFTDGAKAAVASAEAIGDRIGQVYGVISAGGKTEVIYFDKIKNQVETVSKAAFDRLSKEKAVTKETEKQSTELDKQIKRFQTVDAQVASLLGKTKEVQVATPTSKSVFSDTQGSFVFFPSNMMNEDEGNRKMAELAKTLGGNYLRVLAETIRTGGEGLGFMPETKLGAVARDISAYRTALENVKLAQEQANAAQKRYNDGIKSGRGDIVVLGANVRNANEALAQSKIELQSAESGFRAASVLASRLGIDVASIPPIGQFLPAPEELGNALQQWNNYINGVSVGNQQLQTSSSAAQQEWNDYVNSVVTGTQQVMQQGSVDAFSPLVEAARNATIEGGEVLREWDTYVQQVQSGIRGISESSVNNPLNGLTDGADTASTALRGAEGTSEVISSNFDNTATKANEIRNSLLELDGKTIEIFVKQTPLAKPYFAGGPVAGGQQIQVNELGREGFLSSSGKLTPINAPSYGIWRTPGAGTIIPAHIMDSMSVPSAGVKVNSGGKHIDGGGGLQGVAKTLFNAMSSFSAPQGAINELALVQAGQSVQIGKLSRAIDKLAEKDWDVKVNVRPNSSTSYIDQLSRRL